MRPFVLRRKTRAILFAAALALAALAACSGCSCRSKPPAELGQQPPAAVKPNGRPARWAQPLQLAGCPNLHKVSGELYRGAQPAAEGFKHLKELGIKTVINLRSAHHDRGLTGGLEFNHEEIPMEASGATDEHIVRFLAIIADKTKAPFFVHCEHGSDRTGLMCAAYRLAVEGWTKDDAIKEMTDGGYGFHSIFHSLIERLRNLDVHGVKRRAGL